MYDLTNVDDACIDSDYLLEVIQLVINRTDETEESKNGDVGIHKEVTTS